MRLKPNNTLYKRFIFFIILVPNIFTAILGVESFPFTAAPMFGHYIGDETDLYLIKFEGVSEGDSLDLLNYYGKPEVYLIRNFYCKIYGSPGNISAFHGRLTDNPEKFQIRMNNFFNDYVDYAKAHHNLELQQIYLKATKVNKEREVISKPQVLGYYSVATNQYIRLHEVNE